MRLFHIVAPDIWDAAVAVGDYRPGSLVTEHFVHFSFADQVAGVANMLYASELALIAVEIDGDRVTHRIRVEDSYGTGREYPHVYGAIDPAWAVAVHPLVRDAAGMWLFTPGAGTAPATADR